MTTRECVQLVTGSYFRSRKKDGGHAIRSVVGSYAALTLHRSVCYRRRVISDGNFMHLCVTTRCGLFGPVTLTLTR